MAEPKNPVMKRGADTIMYSVELDKDGNREVVQHRFPWDKNSKYSAGKFQRLIDRGFTFERPDISVAAAGVKSKR